MATKRKKHLFASIEKMEPQEDGTLKVWGHASTTAKDSDGEIITAAAMKAAIPGYMKFGAVREMHQASAAGTAIEASVDDATGKTWFGAHVVDPIAVKKVETGVYKGFSIGGKVTKRDELNKTIIQGIDLVEVSLVDRPANPEAVFTLYKAERTEEDDVVELAAILDKGDITPARVLELIKSAEGTGSQEAPPQGGVPSTEPEPLEPVVEKVDEPVVATADDPEVKKGMYTIANMADLLNAVSWMCQDVKSESEYMGDGSAIPAAMVSWLKSGVKLLNEMTAEESAKLIATVSAKKAATPTDTNGIAPITEDAIQKMVASAIAPVNESLEKLGKENEDLKQQVATLKKSAAPGKALLRAFSLAKGQDVLPDPVSEPDTDAPPEGTPERATHEMRKVFANRGARLS